MGVVAFTQRFRFQSRERPVVDRYGSSGNSLLAYSLGWRVLAWWTKAFVVPLLLVTQAAAQTVEKFSDRKSKTAKTYPVESLPSFEMRSQSGVTTLRTVCSPGYSPCLASQSLAAFSRSASFFGFKSPS